MKRVAVAFGAALTLNVALADGMEALMLRCAPQVHPKTLGAIVHQESRGRAFVISDDGPANLPWSVRRSMLRSFDPVSKDEAANLVDSLTKQGHMVGIGLTQIGSRHLARMGVSVQDALDPCTNLRLGAQVLVEFHAEAVKRYSDPQKALLAAISAYNTGSFEGGFSNGYVQKVVNAAQYRLPELKYGRVVSAKLGHTNGPGVKVASVRVSVARSRASSLLQAKLATVEVGSY